MFSTYKPEYTAEYTKLKSLCDSFRKLELQVCRLLYCDLLQSEVYNRSLVFGLSSDVEIDVDVPKVLSEIGLDRIVYKDQVFKLIYLTDVLKLTTDRIYKAFEDCAWFFSVDSYDLSVETSLNSDDVLDEFYYDTWMLLGRPKVAFKPATHIIYNADNVACLSYGDLVGVSYDTPNVFPDLFHKAMNDGKIIVYLNSIEDYYSAIYFACYHEAGDVLFYYVVRDTAKILDELQHIAYSPISKGTKLCLIIGCKYKELKLHKFDMIMLKNIFVQFNKHHMAVRFEDQL